MKKLLIILLMSVLLIGCGNTDTTDNAQETEAPQTQEEQKQEEPKHEHAYTENITTEATCVCGLTDTRTAEGSKLEYTFSKRHESCWIAD